MHILHNPDPLTDRDITNHMQTSEARYAQGSSSTKGSREAAAFT